MFSPPTLYILLAVLVLLIVGLIFVYLVIRRARRQAVQKAAEAELVTADEREAEQPDELSSYASSVGLRLSFSRAAKRINSYASGKGARYRVPWYLMIGEAQSGKTTLLGNTGLNLLFDMPKEKTGGKQAVNWFFFDQGIVLDVAGDFVLKADGETSDGKGWHSLTRLLQRHRPERPLDGIILTIPAGDLLMGGPNLSADAKLKLEQKAHRLYKKLLAAQKTLGMNLPVYVLVTKCDLVTGFKSLCHEIPDRRNEIFGWSSPYTREIAYRAEWVTEAFQNLYRYLFQLQIEVFAERDEVRHSDELFMLPSEMRSMRVPLQLYLDHIFKESAYHDSFFLRGIYFCGDSSAATDAPDSSLAPQQAEPEIDWLMPPPNPTRVIVPEQTAPAGRRPAFVGHLFERKIFQEELLARPINRTMLSRNRTVMVAQVLSLLIPLVGILGILLTYPGLQERERSYYKFLTAEEDDLRAMKEEKETGVKDAHARSREARLFEAMSHMDGKRLSSLFIPTSWFSDINRQSGQSVSSAYQYIIFESLRRELDCRTENKLPLPSSAPCAALATVPDPSGALKNCGFEPDPAAAKINTFIESLEELIVHRELYRKIIRDNTGEVADLSKLLVYLGHAPLPANFDKRNNLFAQALKGTQGAPLRSSDEDVYARGECKVKWMIQDIYNKSFQKKSVSYSYLSEITKTEALLSRPDNSWLATRRFDEEGAAFYRLTISSAVSELKRALNDLSNQKFMPKDPGAETGTQSEPEEPLRRHAARQVILWDTESLKQAVALYKDYAGFVGSANYQNPNTLDYKVKEAALNALEQKMRVLIGRARRVQPPQRIVGETASLASLNTEIASFKRAQSLLSQLMEICDTLGIDVGLRRALSEQTNSLMRAINKEFGAEDFYATMRWDFSRWQLDQPFQSYMLFGASNPDELEVYLADQRTGITDLGSQYAAPVLNFMSAQGIQLQSSGRSVNWNTLLGQLDKYDNQKPGNTVAVLENFIRVEMNKVSLDNCPAILTDYTPQYGDYFLQVRNSLRQSLYQRCEQLAGVRIALIEQRAREQMESEFYRNLKSYIEIEQSFNNTLAGRFPFSDVPQTEPFAEADPAAIDAFFQLLQANKATAMTALGQCPQYGISPKAALDFMNDLEQVKLFFASFLQKKPLYPLFDFNLKFRVNENKSPMEPNPIIAWEFTVGKKKFHYQEEPVTGNWGYTDPLTLTLRWAKDAPTVPMPKDAALPRLKVNEKTVTMTYSNNWSLLLLLLKNKGAGSDFANGVDIEPYTLRFNVPTAPNPSLPNSILQAQPRTLVTPEVVVYIRLSLVTPSQKDPLIVPETFPKSAPRLTNRTRAGYQSSEQE
jgi:type VI secretion system protein ImpL